MYNLKGRKILIFGGGKYGIKALKFAKKENAKKIYVVDKNSFCHARQFLSKKEFLLLKKEAILDLIIKLNPDFIIPAMPGHTMGKLFKETFNLKPFPEGLSMLKKYLLQSLILTKSKAKSTLVLSYMPKGKTCIENCIPPDGYCRLTKEPRPTPVYALLNYAIFGKFDLGKVFISEQIAIGLGGIRTKNVLKVIDEIKEEKPKTLAIGTACQCHGIRR